MASTTAQINVKLPSDLKSAGDAALAEIGLSASALVRALWEAVARRGECRERVTQTILEEASSSAMDPERQARVNAAISGQSIMSATLRRMGVDAMELAPLTDDEIDELRYEHFVEKGLA